MTFGNRPKGSGEKVHYKTIFNKNNSISLVVHMSKILIISQKKIPVPNHWETVIPTGRYVLGEVNQISFMSKKTIFKQFYKGRKHRTILFN
jgi:hypothetical protein